MKSRWLPIVLAVTAAALTSPAGAHHPFSAIYRADETVQIEGEVVQLLFRNPHSILHVLAPDTSGKMTRWAVEWQGATQLGAGGIDAQTLRPGDPVIVKGNPGRDPAEHLLVGINDMPLGARILGRGDIRTHSLVPLQLSAV